MLDEIAHIGAKVVLAGDAKQLPEINAGGLFAGIGERVPSIELCDNRRQQHEWEQEALRQLRDGDTTAAFHAYLANHRITVGHDAHHAKTLLLADWWASYVAGDDAVMLAGHRADVTELKTWPGTCAPTLPGCSPAPPSTCAVSRSRPGTR